MKVWTAWPHPKDKGQQWPFSLLDWRGKRLALPEPRGGKVKTRGETEEAQFSGRGRQEHLAVSECWTQAAWTHSPRGGPGSSPETHWLL